jgi:hypothetical protein
MSERSESALAKKLGDAVRNLNDLTGKATERGLSVKLSVVERSHITTHDKICRYAGVAVQVSKDIPHE